ncbi:MAG: hypothetical protein F4010_04035 [Cenarchaeum sp. SB0669_bin_11]|nr:hypothetical protein [Acidobacteriota bacterium]MYL11313.1 hypothetical protein [Cenarchaeum sp. SB0669_bin_11]
MSDPDRMHAAIVRDMTADLVRAGMPIDRAAFLARTFAAGTRRLIEALILRRIEEAMVGCTAALGDELRQLRADLHAFTDAGDDDPPGPLH